LLIAYHVVKVPEEDRNLQYSLNPIESLTCLVRLLDAQFEDGTKHQIHSCTLDDNLSSLGGLMYEIDLSEDFVSTNSKCIKNGACYVDIPGGQVVDEEGATPTIEIPEAAELTAIDLSESAPIQRRKLGTFGVNNVLVVRLKSIDKSCTPTREQLAASVFGINGNAYGIDNSMKSQYEACSKDQFSFNYVSGNGVKNGVVDVYMNEYVTSVDIFKLTNAMFQAASDAVDNSLSASPNHVMYVVPSGTTFNGSSRWVAFAHVGGFNSWYNDDWGDMLSAQVHEVGHNLGM